MRKRFLLAVGVVAALMLSALGPVAGAQSRAGAGHQVGGMLDPDLPVHPYLQYGARVEPDRRVRIIVQKANPAADSKAIARAAGTTALEEFPFVHSLVLEVPQRVALTLARQPGVRYVSYDGPVRGASVSTASLRTTHQAAIHIPDIWNATPGATGRGVTVAVLDSGVNANHLDLRASVMAVLVNKKATGAKDQNGHGTHVIGIIKGVDSQGHYLGIAPDSSVISIQIADDQGASTEADLLRGLQWVNDNRTLYNIRAINLSVNAEVATSYQSSPLAAAVEQLWVNGVVVVVAAGNRGSAPDATWHPPGNDPFVISVGALDHNQTADPADDSLAAFSSRGATQDGVYKPEVVAPGRKIVSTLSGNNSTLAQLFPTHIVDSNYLRLSGTSMAAPVVAGVVALLLERYPNLTPNQVKWLLMTTTTSFPGQPDAAGLINPVSAMGQAATGPVSEANQGLVLNSGVSANGGTVQWGSAYWDSAYWDSAYWDASSYDFVVDD